MIDWGLFIIVASNIFMKNLAYDEALEKKRILLTKNEAINQYINYILRPEVFDMMEDYDVPESYFNPVFMFRSYARKTINRIFVEEMDRGYYIREVAFEPRSPYHIPDETEERLYKKLLKDFELKKKSTTENVEGKHSLRHIQIGEIMEPDCLSCHGDPADAPEGLIDKYGKEKGFNHEGDVASANSLVISLEEAYQQANSYSFKFGGFYMAFMLGASIVFSKSTNTMIFNRLDKIKSHFDAIRKGEKSNHNFLSHGNKDEIDDLIINLNSMSKTVGDYENELLKERNKLEDRVREQTKKLKEKNEELKYYNKLAEEQFEKAHRIHRQMFPSQLFEIEGLNFDAYHKPAEKMGGDFYYIDKISYDKVLFYISDVAGHGLDGAMLNILLRESINQYISLNSVNEFSPVDMLKFVHSRFVEEEFPVDYFICLLVGVVDLNEEKIWIANAGIHIPPLISVGGEEVIETEVKGSLISKIFGEGELEFEEKVVDFPPGSLLFLSTDGMIEETKNKERFGLKKIENIINENRDMTTGEINKKIQASFESFVGKDNNVDDITYLLIKKT